MSDEINVESNEVPESVESEVIETEVVEDSSEREEISVQADTEEELTEEIEQAIEDGATQEEVKNMVREFTIKVNGKEMVKSLDLSDEESIRKELQLAAAGRGAMQEAAELRKAFTSDVERLKDDPFLVLEEMGLDPLQLSSGFLEKYLAEQEKSPEQKENEMRQQEIEKLRKENEAFKKEVADKHRQALYAETAKQIEDEIISTLDSDSDLPKTPKVIARVADTLLWAIENVDPNATVKDVIPTVKKELQKEFSEVASSLKSRDALKALLGEDVLNSLREERVQQAQKLSSAANLKRDVVKDKKLKKDSDPDKKRISLSDFMR